ncbi:MAG: hypothetical protein ACRCV7_03335 [Culicoidibacterales bacterium]
MENQTNNNEIIQDTEVVEQVETVEVIETTEQPQFTPEENVVVEEIGTTPTDAEVQTNKKKKKTLIIAIIIGALVLLLGGVGTGVYAFMNTPEMKISNAMTKIQKSKKIDGTMKLQGSATLPTVLKAETVEMKIDGTYSASRGDDKDPYLKLDAKTNVSGSKQLQQTIDAMHINGNYGLTLTKDMVFNWNGLGQKGSIPLTEEQKQSVKKLIEANGDSLTEEQKAAQELYAFVLKGYTPVLENEGNKTFVKITKAELEKLIQTAEKNIASNSEKFEELYKKANKATKDTEMKSIVKSAKDGTIVKQVKPVLDVIDTFNVKVAYEDLGNSVKQTIDMDMVLKQSQGGVTINAKFNFQFATTYHM